MFKRRVEKFIEDKALFGRKDKVLVALSGGADSVALLRVLLSLGYTCECAHCIGDHILMMITLIKRSSICFFQE